MQNFFHYCECTHPPNEKAQDPELQVVRAEMTWSVLSADFINEHQTSEQTGVLISCSRTDSSVVNTQYIIQVFTFPKE